MRDNYTVLIWLVSLIGVALLRYNVRDVRDTNGLVLMVYLICVAYVIYEMIKSIDDQIKVEANASAVKQKLEELNLQDKIEVSFKIKDRYEINDPKELSLVVKNKSNVNTVYIYWDNCSFIDFDGRSRRVIWLTPTQVRDLAVPQVESVIAPGQTLREQITTADVMERDEEKGTYKVTKPLIDINGLQKGLKARRKMYNGFMKMNLHFDFSLRLVVKLFVISGENDRQPFYVVEYPFTVKKLPWTYALPWNQKRKPE
jgi:hypothetical protein